MEEFKKILKEIKEFYGDSYIDFIEKLGMTFLGILYGIIVIGVASLVLFFVGAMLYYFPAVVGSILSFVALVTGIVYLIDRKSKKNRP